MNEKERHAAMLKEEYGIELQEEYEFEDEPMEVEDLFAKWDAEYEEMVKNGEIQGR